MKTSLLYLPEVQAGNVRDREEKGLEGELGTGGEGQEVSEAVEVEAVLKSGWAAFSNASERGCSRRSSRNFFLKVIVKHFLQCIHCISLDAMDS
jgi:hypothetical protein